MPPPVPSPVMELLRTARLRPRMWIVPPRTLLETRTASPPTTMLPPPRAFPWTPPPPAPVENRVPLHANAPPGPRIRVRGAAPEPIRSEPIPFDRDVPSQAQFDAVEQTHKRGILDPNVGRVPQVDTVALSPRSRSRDRHAADHDIGVGVRDVDRRAPGRDCEAPSGDQVRVARGSGPTHDPVRRREIRVPAAPNG